MHQGNHEIIAIFYHNSHLMMLCVNQTELLKAIIVIVAVTVGMSIAAKVHLQL